jgi:drug/metabolite transporter (DMT)-like permease
MKPVELAALILLGVLWGSAFLLIDVAIDEVEPLTLVAGRLIIAALLLGAIVLLSGRTLPGRSRWRVLLLLGALSNVLPFALITWAQQHIASSLAATLNSTMPLLTFVIAAAAGDERASRERVAGLIIGFIGAAVLIGPDLTEISSDDTLAQLAVLGGSASYALGTVIARTRLGSGDVTALAAGQLAFGALLATPLALAVDGAPAFDLSWKAALAWLGLGVSATAFAYIIFYWLVQRLRATDVAAVSYLIPIVATLLGWLVLDETIGPNLFVGLALIIAGMAVINGVSSAVAERLRRPAARTPAG